MADKNDESNPTANPDDVLRWNTPLPGTNKAVCWGQPGATWGGKVRDLQKRTTMTQQNLAELRLTQAWITELLGLLNAARDKMKEKSISLTPDQRSTLGNIGLNNLGMVEAGLGLIKDNPGWFPVEFDRQEPADDMADRALWLQVQGVSLEIAELWQDTAQAMGSDIVRAVSDANPYITQGAKLTGASDTRLAIYKEYYKRYRTKKAATPPANP